MERPTSSPGLYEGYTAFHHLRAVAGQGAAAGVFLLNEYVARKGLGATRWHILLLLLVPAMAQFAAVVWNPTDPRRLLGRRPFRVLGVPAYAIVALPLLVAALRGPTPFVVLLALCGLVQMLLVPAQNAILARNYAERTRGRRFGAATAVQALAIVAVGLPAGWLLDRRPDAWTWIYALAGAAGVLGVVQWSRLKRRRPPPPPEDLAQHASPWQALRGDRHFLAFEACFMVYGTGFLMLAPVVPIYLVDELEVTYSQVSVARGAIFWLTMVLAGVLVGRLADRLGILRLGALAFLVLAGFPLALLLLGGATGLYVAFAVFGLAMCGVHLTWNLGPIAMARGRDPLPYLNAHLALVGLRAGVAMTAGTLLQQHLGSRTVFGICVGLQVAAAAGMWLTARWTGRRWTVPP